MWQPRLPCYTCRHVNFTLRQPPSFIAEPPRSTRRPPLETRETLPLFPRGAMWDEAGAERVSRFLSAVYAAGRGEEPAGLSSGKGVQGRLILTDGDLVCSR